MISLSRSLLGIGGEFGHGTDDLLGISLHGTARGTEYGAVDAASANLRGGALSVEIDFGLTADEYVFDLIVSAALDGILGDFASVDILGLDPSYASTVGTVLDDLGAGLTEIYRLTLTQRQLLAQRQVPEPAPLLLLIVGGTALLRGLTRRASRA